MELMKHQMALYIIASYSLAFSTYADLFILYLRSIFNSVDSYANTNMHWTKTPTNLK